MIREGTSGAEGKQKGIERKDLVLKRRRQSNVKGSSREYLVQRHTGRKIRLEDPTPGRDIKASYQPIEMDWNYHQLGNSVKSYAVNEIRRGKFVQD